MKKKTERIYRTIGVFTAVAIVFSGCGTAQSRKGQDGKNLKIGISVYDQYDTFVSELVSNFQDYAKTREKDWGISITLDVENANKSQMIQNDQMDDFMEWTWSALTWWTGRMRPPLLKRLRPVMCR